MASLTIAGAETKSRRVNIETEKLVIGRSAGTDLPLEDSAISGEHGEILREGNKYRYRDLDSTNGSLLNGETVTESPLKAGDIITLGAIDITIEGDDIEPGSAPAPLHDDTLNVPPSSSARASSVDQMAQFNNQKSKKSAWVIVLIIAGILVIAAGAWFVMNYFKS